MTAWEYIYEKMQAGLPVILMYVLQSSGSSPGRRGFVMGIAGDGSIDGSIGGGMMEHKFVQMAKSVLAAKREINQVFRQVHDKEAGKNQSGMICSGEQTIFVYSMRDTDFDSIGEMIISVKQGKTGTLKVTSEGLFFHATMPATDFSYLQNESGFILSEKTGFKNVIHIVGGGHCSLALSKLMSSLDFQINVYEERQDLNTLANNSYAHHKTVLDSYRLLPEYIVGGDNTYVVIMTVGFRSDELALRSLAQQKFRYLGVLGSKNKMIKMFSNFSEEEKMRMPIESVNAPIGIQIRSKTPAEIAISIAAEIIAKKNNA